ncbi:hypothetical protein C8J57DRAFT_1635845 [Mycena rebaudengoi]|nr:hypothetical protein C8J57DRAFT_1635845 [Mycena rebaudengoi]
MSKPPRRKFSAATFACTFPRCRKLCKNSWGLSMHIAAAHPELPRASPIPEDPPEMPDGGLGFDPDGQSPPPSRPPTPPPQPTVPPAARGVKIEYHPVLDGTPCDKDGYDLPPNTPPPPWEERAPDDYSPFEGRAEFEFAEFLYTHEEMAATRVDKLAQLLAALYEGSDPPFADHKDLYSTIDAIQQGDVPWESFSVKYTGPLPESGEVPAWMTETYEVWYRAPLGIFEKQLANPDFKDEMDWAPKRIFKNGKRQFTDLFSGNWVWDQAEKIAKDPNTHGSMFVPGVLGSDKTTVSVGTGNTEFYPFYSGVGNIHNSTRRAHREGITITAFLNIPKSPYIADYPEQALLTNIVQNWCPRCLSPPYDLDQASARRSHEHTDALMEGCTLKELWDDFGIVGDLLPFTTGFSRADIHELISMDLLHQVIKGTFKDHVVDWVEAYIRANHEKAEADRILADIDRRIAVTPSFPGLRHFHVGRGYKQWTGNDSKGLMKVYLPAIAGHLPSTVVQAVADIIEFCHLVRRSVIDEDTLLAIDAAVARFHQHREIFREDVRPDGFSLPRQHSIVHYRDLIQLFGAPNGLCSSITESKHIKAVKKPYRRSSHNKPLGQMLLTNQRLNKLAAARVDFTARGMLEGSLLPPPPQRESLSPDPDPDPDDEHVENGAVDGPTCLGEVKLAKTYVRKIPRDIAGLSEHVGQPRLCELIRRFLFDQLNPDAPVPGGDVVLADCPEFSERVFAYNSARAVFYAPSDISGIGGMHHERIRATKSWYGGAPRYDCALIEHDTSLAGFRGLHAVRVRLFFRFKFRGVTYPCALIHWFSIRGDAPCPDTGMWIVEPDFNADGEPSLAVVHLDCMLRGVHLIGVAANDFIPIRDFDFSDSLDAFSAFYVNKYADHHAHETVF